MKEFEVGQTTEYEGKKIKCVLDGCKACAINDTCKGVMRCTSCERDDGNNVHFEEVK